MNFLEKNCGQLHGLQQCRVTRRARVDAESAVAFYGGGGNVGDQGLLTDWHGNVLGTASVLSRWPVKSTRVNPGKVSSYALHVRGSIDGVLYAGRTLDRKPAGCTWTNELGHTIWRAKRIGAPRRVAVPRRIRDAKPRLRLLENVPAGAGGQASLPGFNLPVTLTLAKDSRRSRSTGAT